MSTIRNYVPVTLPATAESRRPGQTLAAVRKVLAERICSPLPVRKVDSADRRVRNSLLAASVVAITTLAPAPAADWPIERPVESAPRDEAEQFEKADWKVVRGYARHLHRR